MDDGLEAFCHAEQLRLIGMLALYVGDRWTAEELAQDALARACQHWPRVSKMADRRAWLNRVAMNLAKSWFRRRYAGRRARRRHEDRTQPLAGPATLPDVARADEVRAAVAALPRRQRTAVILRFYEDLSVADTAAFMGCAQGTVKSLTHKATTALRGHLTDVSLEEVPDGA